MAFNFMFPLRIAQAIFAFLVMALTAAVINSTNANSNYYGYGSAYGHPTVNFVLFTAVWTLLVLAFLVIVPARFPAYAHKFTILGVEFVTMIFWFAGFIAFAVLLSPAPRLTSEPFRVAQAACAFSAFAWACFAATFGLAALHVWRTRNTGETRADPHTEMRQEV